MKKFFLLLFFSALTFAQGPTHIKNFGQVEESLIYRGAQPDAAGLLELKNAGFKTIIDLRGDRTVIREAIEVHDLDMDFIDIPMSGIKAPTQKQLQYVMAALYKANKPVFIHCKEGKDRTGTMIAIERMLFDGWSNKMAIQEAKFYHIHWYEFWMKRYIKNFKVGAPPASTITQ